MSTEPSFLQSLTLFLLGLIREVGVKDATSYLMKLGGAPLLTNGSWNDEAFNISTLFTSEPDLATKLCLGHHLMHCKDPRNASREILCFENDDTIVITETLVTDTMYVLKHLKLDSAAMEEGLATFVQFLILQRSLRVTFSDYPFKVINIRDLKKAFPMIPMMDWLKVINSQLTSDSQVTGEEEILIRNFDKMKSFAKLMMLVDKS